MGQKSRWTLPETVHPDRYRRFVICVPDERFYIAAFQGLLIELTYSKNWQRDSSLTAAAVSRVWQDVLANVTCEQECTTVIEEMEYQMSLCEQLRFNDGVLQGLCCGEWTDITGQPPQGIGGPGQPGSGSRQPLPGGGEECYHADFPATYQWNLPTIVSAGDTIEVKNTGGTATDAPNHVWYCPNGQLFFAGACISTPFLQGGDPAATANHMTIVCQIAGVWYPCDGIITVPGGVSNQPVVFQVNDGVLSDNSGGYKFDVCVTNNGAVSWCKVLDFALQDFGFVIDPEGIASRGLYTLGTGWTETQAVNAGGVWRRAAAITKALGAAYNVTQVDLTYSLTKGVTDTVGDNCVYIGSDLGALNVLSYAAAVDGSNLVLSSGPVTLSINRLDAAIVSDRKSGSNAGFAGAGLLRKIVMQGTGTPPPFGADC